MYSFIAWFDSKENKNSVEGNNLESGQNQIIGLWANANHQGETAGINMAGGDMAYKGNILHNITHFMNMDFIGFEGRKTK